ncbi:MAG: beta-ketoacyl-[acyl-carrier-protein] synthase family protein [Planctomycetia bacterium]
MSQSAVRRVVVTGMGVVSPLGLTLEELWSGLAEGRSAVGPLESFPCAGIPLTHAAEARGFTGDIGNFGELSPDCKKAIRKGLKVMCRESQMAVAAAQRALQDGQFSPESHEPERFGCVFGSDYMLTLPEDFTTGAAACRDDHGRFAFERWAEKGMPLLNPLWLLKYLPNMPASHVAIYNDLRGPSNSITVREASGHLAIGEAVMTIQRGAADIMLAGATGTRVHPMKAVHALQNEQVAFGGNDPTAWSRPFDGGRSGMVLGEGAAVVVLEDLEHALSRGARIHGEIIGHGAGSASTARGPGGRRKALAVAMRRALESAQIATGAVSHIHAQGLSTVAGDREEAAAIGDVFADRAAAIPTVAAKSHFGNLGAGSGVVECIGSMLAMQHGELFPLLNYQTVDQDCPVRPARRGDAAGNLFISSAATPHGQASSVVIRAWTSA